MENSTECKLIIITKFARGPTYKIQVGFTNVSETLLNNVERYAIVVASMGNASDSEQQNRLRKSRENVGKTIQSYRQLSSMRLVTYIHI